jgi:single-strand DNA-binding protein
MAGSLNKAILIGRLGRDPEMRYTPSGQPVANFSIATDETYTGKDGQKVEKTEWHRIVVWGKQAEFCGNYLAKGRLVYIEGKIETRKWTDKDGVEKYTTEIKADRVQGLDSRPNEGGYAAAPQYQQRPQGAPQGGSANAGYDDDMGPAFPSEASGMDDAPF